MMIGRLIGRLGGIVRRYRGGGARLNGSLNGRLNGRLSGRLNGRLNGSLNGRLNRAGSQILGAT